MASVMIGTAMSVSPVTIPLAISITTCGQNLGSYFCPMITTFFAARMGEDVSKNAFLFGAVLFGVMGLIALIWGIAQNSKKPSHA
jgi:Na+/melibiose symporter-like transporter